MPPKTLFCQGTKPDGNKRRARPVTGGRFCFFHDPEKCAERQAAQRAGGGTNRQAVLPSTTPDARLLNLQDVVRLLAAMTNRVLRGEVGPRVANAVGYLCGLQIKALHEIDAREAGRLTVDRDAGRLFTDSEADEMLARLTDEDQEVMFRLLDKARGWRVKEVEAGGQRDVEAGSDRIPTGSPNGGTTGAGGGSEGSG